MPPPDSAPPTRPSHDKVLIVDFGSQVTQLIARRVREACVYCEIVPFQAAERAFAELRPKAVILSGGPCSVADAGSPRAPRAIFDAGVPVLGICYGEQVMAVELGGEVEGGHAREFGRAEVEILADSKLFEGVWERGRRYPVWMSHGDRVTALPAGFRVIARRRMPRRRRSPTRRGASTACNSISKSSTRRTARRSCRISCTRSRACKADWTMAAFRQEAIAAIRAQGRRRPRALRPFRRGRFGGGGGAHPRGDRRAAHLRLRRPWPVAAGRGGRGGRACSATITISRSCMWRPRTVPGGARRRHRSGEEAQDHRPPVHRGLRRARRRRSPRMAAGRRNFWRRGRSIPT